jgi:hypothetical protein
MKAKEIIRNREPEIISLLDRLMKEEEKEEKEEEKEEEKDGN